MKKVVLAGGTGFVGQDFAQRFRKLGYEVLIISRQPGHIAWEDRAGIIGALEEAEMLINLAGKSVNCRYTDENRKVILESRTRTTRILGEAILACNQPPELWINSSTATIYRHAEDRPMTEKEGEIGSGFSVDVAKAWEQAFFEFSLPSTRQIALRIAIVLGEGGVMVPMTNLVRFGLGGSQGTGTQQFNLDSYRGSVPYGDLSAGASTLEWCVQCVLSASGDESGANVASERTDGCADWTTFSSLDA